MQTVEQTLEKLGRSKFRAGFHLDDKDRQYVREKGESVIKMHAEAFIAERLAPAQPRNDGKQTPMRGHPVFKAQHACACCCRGCLNKWYGVPLGRALTGEEQSRIVNLLMSWIRKQL